ncbi:AraC-like ligand-binding domain-containing protein [Amycolatopsis aidingensis]|uniref:AraC-like ligand-binding domain-containing protein n=1 Tax=Amycolatopsis aidingensis TaxID=2842453 RepID=UPI001E4F75FC|nr:AraC family transcriptional regulator [Amycolatopsis aidingensis]
MGVLERFAVLSSPDLDEFRHSVSQFLTPHRLTPLAPSRSSVRTDLSKVSVGPVSLVYCRNRGVELGVHLTEQVDYYDVNLSLHGHNRVVFGRDEVVVDQDRAAVISPRMRVDMRLSDDYRQLHVRVERQALTEHLEAMLGRPAAAVIRFEPEMDLTGRAAGSWARTVRLLLQELDEPESLAERSLGTAPWANLLMTGLLLAQPNNYSPQLERLASGLRQPTPVRRVMELIERDPSGDLSVERLARAVRMTPRSLQRHFRSSLGVSPHEYVQQVRLARAHEELRVAEPRSVTVTEVALRWGFTHVPRFAGLYRKRYGTNPSQTLRDAF